MTMIAFGLAGLSLMGVPPSGGFVAKWLLLTASVATGQWWWALVMLGGGLLAGGYVFRVLAQALGRKSGTLTLREPVPRRREALVLSLAVCSVVFGLLPLGSFGLLRIGRPDTLPLNVGLSSRWVLPADTMSWGTGNGVSVQPSLVTAPDTLGPGLPGAADNSPFRPAIPMLIREVR